MVAYSVQSLLPRYPSQNDATTRNPTKIRRMVVTLRLGAKMANGGNFGRNENLKNNRTLRETDGSHSRMKDPTQLAEHCRLLAQFPPKHKAASQKGTNGRASFKDLL